MRAGCPAAVAKRKAPGRGDGQSAHHRLFSLFFIVVANARNFAALSRHFLTRFILRFRGMPR